MVKIKKFKIKKDFIDYDKDVDILTLTMGKQTHHSINIDDCMIIDLDIKNKPVGFEILSISKLMGIPKQFLDNLKYARAIIRFIPEEKKIFITLGLTSVKDEKESIRLPSLEAPIVSY